MITDALEATDIAGFRRRVVAPPPFYVAQVPGKGVGLVANATIRRGDYVMVETPTVMVRLATHFDPQVREGIYTAVVQRLPALSRRVFTRQMGDGMYGKIDTNCFRVFVESGNEASGHLGCYPATARLNHDCRPNMNYHITNMTQMIVAVRDIAPGEELTISYIDSVMTRAERQERLQDWGFTCSCPQCQLQGAEAAASDKRIKAISEVTKEFDMRVNPRITPDTGAELAALHEEEKLWIYLGHAYTRAALNYGLFGKEKEAIEYAQKAIEALELEFGPDAPDIAAMQALAAGPRNHWSWELRKNQT